jgi:hypothetical protein
MDTVGQMGSLEDVPPAQTGWYATLHCWEVEEGMFPDAHYWNGSEWEPETTASILYWPTQFDSKEEAERFARDNDPEW